MGPVSNDPMNTFPEGTTLPESWKLKSRMENTFSGNAGVGFVGMVRELIPPTGPKFVTLVALLV